MRVPDAINRLRVWRSERRDALELWWGEAPGRPYDLTEAVDDPLSDDSDRPESAPSRDAPLDHGSARL